MAWSPDGSGQTTLLAFVREFGVQTASVTFPRPFSGVPQRLVCLRLALLLGCFFGMLASLPLWASSRPYPLVPVAAWFPVFSSPADWLCLGVLLGSLLSACWTYRPSVIFFLVGSLFLACGDQNRWQPWFYMYWVMLLLSLQTEATTLAACRLAFSAIYFWAGVQKLNPDFFQIAVPWMIQPAAAWVPAGAVKVLGWLIGAAPAIEMFIAVGVWFSRSRPVALTAVVLVHLTSLILLGPLGHKHNLVIWPWNIFMPVMAVVLFWRCELRPVWQPLRQSRVVSVVLLLFSVLPSLSYLGWWDSYLSFCLYSGGMAKADLFLSGPLYERLPLAIRAHAAPTPGPFNPQVQGPYVLVIQLWAEKELRAPPPPEPRVYRAVAREVAGYAAQADDLHLIIAPRRGPIEFYTASALRAGNQPSLRLKMPGDTR